MHKLSWMINETWIVQYGLETLSNNGRQVGRQASCRLQFKTAWMKNHMADCKQSSYATI